MGQDRNAANKGDQLKHALLLEVLDRWTQLPLTYAETHGGAGIYNIEGQEENQHIINLKNCVRALDGGTVSGAGARYYDLLNNWWSIDAHAEQYPGSVLQAVIQLETNAGQNVRVTEASGETYRRLVQALHGFSYEAEQADFQDKMDWLTEKDNLVLLIDPFTYASTADGLGAGQMDIATLLEIFKRCWRKSACVIGFWCAMGRNQPASKNLKTLFHEEIYKVSRQENAVVRSFYWGQYSLAWVGIGAGIEIVKGLPTAQDWQQSWLAGVVKESEGTRV